MNQISFDRESIAMQVLIESIGQIGMSDIMNASRCGSPEATAKELAVLSFAIADAMIAARGESK